MLNQVVMVGRLVEEPKIQELEDGKKVTNITLAVQRSFKNIDGIYDVDFIRCTLWNGVAQNTCEYVNKGDLVGIKGRLQTSSFEKDGENKYTMDVIAEKVTFLTSKKDDIEDKINKQKKEEMEK